MTSRHEQLAQARALARQPRDGQRTAELLAERQGTRIQVRILDASWAPYTVGEIVSVSEALADRMFNAGAAEYMDVEEEP